VLRAESINDIGECRWMLSGERSAGGTLTGMLAESISERVE
jgi:hypothetical protein